MASFSATDAGLEGFRIARENRRAFLCWVLFSFAVSMIGAVVTVSMPAEVRDALATLQAEETPDGRTFLQALLAVAPLLLLGLGIQCVMAAAIYRIILRHDDARFGYLRLGRDELRLMVLTLVYVLIFIALLVAVTLASAIVGGLASIAGPQVGLLVALAAELFSVGLIIYVLVRLSLAPVITFAERRLAVFDSWKLTHGVFWRLFGAYVLALFSMVAITLVALVLFFAVAGIFVLLQGGSLADLGAIFDPDETSIGSYFNPAMLAYMFMGSVITALYYAVIAAPGAWAYQELHGPAPSAP